MLSLYKYYENKHSLIKLIDELWNHVRACLSAEHLDITRLGMF